MDETNADATRDPGDRDAALRARLERLRVLRSAWGVLAPSGLIGGPDIAGSGRALRADLQAVLATQPDAEIAAIPELDARLDELEQEMRALAIGVPVAQLRSTLPPALASDRRGVLDLLDLILGAELRGLPGGAERIPAVDYLVTLLCAGGDGEAPLQDPVTLTPRIYGLCERADAADDDRVPALEAEFFAAADRSDAREERMLRTMRQRKVELGPAYFASRVLRAIVTYNAAMLRQIDADLLASLDWGSPDAPVREEHVPDDGGSVFESEAIREVATALRRRAAGEPPQLTPLDRVAWCLDLAGLRRVEHAAVLSDSVGQADDPEGTTILVGLLARSAVVLDEELPEIGIPLAQLAGPWLRELDQALQRESQRRLAASDYDGARGLTALSSRFLASGPADPRLGRAMRAAATRSAARSAPAEDTAPRTTPTAPPPDPAPANAAVRRRLPWRGAVRIGGLLTGLVAVLLLANFVLLDAGRVSRESLREISPYLASGKRSQEGAGPAFVGRLRQGFNDLAREDQGVEAELIVEGLRMDGVRDVMVYDRDGALRIQALGGGPVRLVE